MPVRPRGALVSCPTRRTPLHAANRDARHTGFERTSDLPCPRGYHRDPAVGYCRDAEGGTDPIGGSRAARVAPPPSGLMRSLAMRAGKVNDSMPELLLGRSSASILDRVSPPSAEKLVATTPSRFRKAPAVCRPDAGGKWAECSHGVTGSGLRLAPLWSQKSVEIVSQAAFWKRPATVSRKPNPP